MRIFVRQPKKAATALGVLKGVIIALITILLSLLLVSIVSHGMDIVHRAGIANHVTKRSAEELIEITVDEPNSAMPDLRCSLYGTKASVTRGQDAIFFLTVIGDVSKIWFSAGSLVPTGFFADAIELEQTGETTIQITCRNVDTLNYDTEKQLAITGGIARSSTGATTPVAYSPTFYIQEPAGKQVLHWIYDEKNYWTTLLTFFIAALTLLYGNLKKD